MTYESLYENNWSEWRPFPNPEKKGYLYAPYGCGVYQLRNAKTGEYILFGQSTHVANRMSSLLLSGIGTRNNEGKRNYVTQNIQDIEYRTIPFDTAEEARSFELFVKYQEKYIFSEKPKQQE
jgi:hypothetical protein